MSSSEIKLTNTLTGRKEVLVPLRAGEVSLYACGPTVYDDPHIGHVRSAFVFEILRRLLERRYRVKFVRNITDVDDKIIDRARKEKVTADTIARKYEEAYREAMQMAGIRRPDVEPHATDPENIRQMHRLIADLIAKGAAYAAEGNVYFRTKAFKEYGRLSCQDTGSMYENVRTEAAPGKEDPLDFALWKASLPDEVSWESPWGRGRPGWHIECSAMSGRYLGETFDIHGGGRDLLFPHHENERAQSMAATGKELARVWIHHGLLTTEGRKMSKSLGNFVTTREVASRVSMDVLRFFFLQSHYTSDADFSWAKMESVQEAVKSMHLFLKKAVAGITAAEAGPAPDEEKMFEEDLNDDMDTPAALEKMFRVLREGNRRLNAGEAGEAARLAVSLRRMGEKVLLFGEIEDDDEGGLRSCMARIEAVRDRMRAAKKFSVSDLIRDELAKMGLSIEDTKTGSRIHRLSQKAEPSLEKKLRELCEKAERLAEAPGRRDA